MKTLSGKVRTKSDVEASLQHRILMVLQILFIIFGSMATFLHVYGYVDGQTNDPVAPSTFLLGFILIGSFLMASDRELFEAYATVHNKDKDDDRYILRVTPENGASKELVLEPVIEDRNEALMDSKLRRSRLTPEEKATVKKIWKKHQDDNPDNPAYAAWEEERYITHRPSVWEYAQPGDKVILVKKLSGQITKVKLLQSK